MMVKDFLANFRQVVEGGEPVVVERRGKPAAVLIPLSEKVRNHYPNLWQELQVLLFVKKAEQSGVDLEEVVSLIRKRIKNNKEG